MNNKLGKKIDYGFHSPRYCYYHHPLGYSKLLVYMYDGNRWAAVQHNDHPVPMIMNCGSWGLYEAVDSFISDEETEDE